MSRPSDLEADAGVGAPNVFTSFWMGGYEGADHINGSGTELRLLQLTQHLERADEDYAALSGFGVRCVRESVGWRTVERNGHFDFSSLHSRLAAARKHGIQVAWTFCHYGWPDDVDVFDDSWVQRFERFCSRTAGYLAEESCVGKRHGLYGAPVYTPINEISFLTWAVCETGLMHPHRGDRHGEGFAVKKRLVRGAIAACDAIWRVQPGARILSVDPLVHVVAPAASPELGDKAALQRGYQFQAWDMLAGISEPHLGGHPRYLDLVGVNYYHDNQWECDTQARLHWHLRDARRLPLRALLAQAYARYRRPIVVAETSHVGEGRGEWIRDVATEVAAALQEGVPVNAVCLYPIIDRPDWENLNHWHKSGLWDLHPAGAALERRLSEPYALDLRHAQRALAETLLELPAAPSSSFTRSNQLPSLVVFCHLRWDFVFQRPQHLLTRMSKARQIIFVEEPVYDAGPAYMEISSPCANIQVLRPHTPVRAPGFHDEQMPVLKPLLDHALQLLCDGAYFAWFYTPMALPLLAGLAPLAVVYDCMDELSAFAQAPLTLRQREHALLYAADIVFTGGPSLYEAKRGQHRAVHCFPSAVDAHHFAKGRDPANASSVLSGLSHPRLGFFGVVDERFDCPLLAAIADARPDWQLCVVGPVVKIDPAILPRRANIHYFGQQSYADLPSFLAGWDVCLMPFAINESTRFISPTKTLEYMAAGRPIVSTAITDVVSLYGDLVWIARSPSEFVRACESALGESPNEHAVRATRMYERVASLSWDATVSQMEQLLEQTIRNRADVPPVVLEAQPVVLEMEAIHSGSSQGPIGSLWERALAQSGPIPHRNTILSDTEIESGT